MRTGIILRIIVLLICLGGVLYSIRYLNTKGINPDYLFLNSSAQKAFLPSEVTRFEWFTASKSFVFDKDQKNQWEPKKNSKMIAGLIEFLSEIQLHSVHQAGKNALMVVLNVANVKWVGSWDGLSFIWTEGPKKGLGEILDSKQNLVFFRGKYILDDISVAFCPSRAREIMLQLDGKNYDLVTSGKNWVDKTTAQNVNTVAVEKWLTRFCKLKIGAVIDASYIQSKTTHGALTLKYVDGQALNISYVDGNLFLTNGYGLILDGLKEALEELKKELPNSTKP